MDRKSLDRSWHKEIVSVSIETFCVFEVIFDFKNHVLAFWKIM